MAQVVRVWSKQTTSQEAEGGVVVQPHRGEYGKPTSKD